MAKGMDQEFFNTVMGLRQAVPTNREEHVMISSLAEQITSFLQLGGPVVTVIAGLSVIALALILVKVFEFLTCGIGSMRRAESSAGHWLANQPDKSLSRISSPKSAADKAVLTTCLLLEKRAAKPDIEERVSIQAARDLHHFAKGVRALEAIAQVAPLIGLFGTVLGMIEAFQALQSAGSNVDPSALAGGIWVALMTTAAGLAVAMPVSLVVTWLEGRLEAERIAIQTLTSNLLLPPDDGPAKQTELMAAGAALSYAR
jgi:biopolymer transport protein ExbB